MSPSLAQFRRRPRPCEPLRGITSVRKSRDAEASARIKMVQANVCVQYICTHHHVHVHIRCMYASRSNIIHAYIYIYVYVSIYIYIYICCHVPNVIHSAGPAKPTPSPANVQSITHSTADSPPSPRFHEANDWGPLCINAMRNCKRTKLLMGTPSGHPCKAVPKMLSNEASPI